MKFTGLALAAGILALGNAQSSSTITSAASASSSANTCPISGTSTLIYRSTTLYSAWGPGITSGAPSAISNSTGPATTSPSPSASPSPYTGNALTNGAPVAMAAVAAIAAAVL